MATMMHICFNSEEQSDPKLFEYRQVADRVWGAGRCDNQEIDKLEESKPALNGYGNGYSTSPIPSNNGKPSARDHSARSEQDHYAIALKTSASHLGSDNLRGKSSVDQAPTISIAPKRQTKNSKGKGEARNVQLRGNGRTSEPIPQRPRSSRLPKEEHAHWHRCINPIG
ncbi:unnamed protein product [Sphagnum jensenii]|uniref:Uncharacterized protein n=1 Tax=Sphagnum jensenii TaxID=128206 RepID=A0ABP1BGI2_9BRYO